MFEKFEEVKIEKRRLGEFFEYAPYRSRVFPEFVKNILQMFKAESILGENWLIVAYKKRPPKPKSVLAVLFNHY